MYTKWLLFFLALLSLTAYATSPTLVDTTCYEGGFYYSFRWLYLLPTVSDGDLQYCTTLTLTGPPLTVDETQNLTAHVQQIEPNYTSGYRFNVGYMFPCTNTHVNVDYFYFRSSESDSVTSPTRTAQTYQFLQNFLGGGYVSGETNDKQQIDQVDFIFSKNFLIDKCLELSPFLGATFAHLQRNLDVALQDFVVPPLIAPLSATLTGSLKSRYWGVGPTIGSDFHYPLFSCLTVAGRLGISALGGHLISKIDSNSQRAGFLDQNFNAKGSAYRFSPIVRSDIGLHYTQPLCKSRLALSLSVGYEVDYYFRTVDRVNPVDGYVNNPNTTPKTTTSSIGLGGPYAQISLTTNPQPYHTKEVLHTHNCCPFPAYGCYLTAENGWLTPTPTSKDLTYAILHSANGATKDQEVMPEESWSGAYHLGYRFCSNFNVDLAYRYFYNDKSDSVLAGAGEGISSLNASGPAGVLFTSAHSFAQYELHQADLTIGKYIHLCNPLDLHSFVGLRYVNVKRTLQNEFLGGTPSTLTQSKFPLLKSKYTGVGPLMGLQPAYYLCSNLGVTALFDIALLVGNTNAKLDQINFGTALQETSNTLRTGNIQTIVPIIDTKIGVFLRTYFCKRLALDLEMGYLFSDYFKAINLVFPNFLTGLNQNNSSLYLSGPYITLNLSGF